MQGKSALVDDLENFISERISEIEESQQTDFFKLEKACYLRGFVDGVNIAGGLTWI